MIAECVNTGLRQVTTARVHRSVDDYCVTVLLNYHRARGRLRGDRLIVRVRFV
jgi:hypothetical protein